MVLPFHIEKNSKRIKNLVKSTMLKSGIDRPIASHIAKNISIAKSYNRSIGMLIDNSKNAAKSFNTYYPLPVPATL